MRKADDDNDDDEVWQESCNRWDFLIVSDRDIRGNKTPSLTNTLLTNTAFYLFVD